MIARFDSDNRILRLKVELGDWEIMASGLTTVNDSSEGKLVHESHNDHRISGTDQHQTTSAKELEDNTVLHKYISSHYR